MNKYRILLVGIVLIMLTIRLQSAIESLRSFYFTLEPIFSNPHASYDEKMSERYPLYFDFMKFIKSETPETSTIHIPNVLISYGEPMWAISSLGITSALLFPRKIVYFNGDSLLAKDATGYVVIVKGQPSKPIITGVYYLIINNDITLFKGNYDPKQVENDEYGLIKL